MRKIVLLCILCIFCVSGAWGSVGDTCSNNRQTFPEFCLQYLSDEENLIKCFKGSGFTDIEAIDTRYCSSTLSCSESQQRYSWFQFDNKSSSTAYIVHDCQCNENQTEIQDKYICVQQSGGAAFVVTGCKCDTCTCADDCISDTEWSDVPQFPGYQLKRTRECQCNDNCDGSCNVTKTEYRCAENYYGTAKMLNNGLTGCTACPSNATCNGNTTLSCNQGYYTDANQCAQCPTDANGIRGTTAGPGATTVTACYIPKNPQAAHHGFNGTFEYIEDCRHD